jgi:hypothetical protein
MDGAEVIFETDPKNPGNVPVWGNYQQVYFRGCQINLPDPALYPLFSPGYSGAAVEMNVDGDGILCGSGGDRDSDNGTGSGGAAPQEIEDSIEAFCYGLGIANKDTDGDGCADWIEIVDINGSRQANIVDVLLVAKRAFNILPPSDSDPLFDVNKNGTIGIVDVLLAAYNSSLLKPNSTCLPE